MTGPAPSVEARLRHPFYDTYRPSAGFVMRTALLPFDELTDWAESLQAPALLDEMDLDAEVDLEQLARAVDADRREGRRRLDLWLRRPEVLEALYVASPDLLHGMEHWRKDPLSKKGRRAEFALWRYAVRMASRATPFGLFSGCGSGLFGHRTRLRLASRSTYRRHTRLDMAYLVALGERLEQEPDLRELLRFTPNSTLYRAGDRLKYAEARTRNRQRSFYLVALEPDDYLERVLARASRAHGARRAELIDELVTALVEDDPELDDAEGRRECAQEAAEYVDSLISTQVLVSDLAPAVTGPDPLASLIDRLHALDEHRPEAVRLENLQQHLQDLDRNGLGSPPAAYEEIAALLEDLPAVDSPWLFQVDLYQSAEERVIGADVLNELGAAIEALYRLSAPPPEDDLIAFRTAFVERWGEDVQRPLLEALDLEIGIGFGDGQDSNEPMPLLNGLQLGTEKGRSEKDTPKVPWGKRQQLLFRLWERAIENRSLEVEIQAEDLGRLEPSTAPGRPLPDAFQAMAAIAAGSEQDVRDGRFQLYLGAVSGPSGARLLGRFCHGEEGIRELVRQHAREEAALEPDALFAELVHLPEGRVGNILCRPSVRTWEIPFLGRSGAPAERQIPLDDLMVSVSSERILLHSRRLGKRVIPRLTSAHGYNVRSLSVYRFLCTLQAQQVGEFFSWSWGPLEKARYLPRVRIGRTVLSRARWRVEQSEISDLAPRQGAERMIAVRQWRERRRIPRRVVLADSDQRLTVDLEDVMALEILLDMAGSQREIVLSELFPDPESLLVSGPEGRFVHELTLPFVRRRATAETSEAKATASQTASARTGIPKPHQRAPADFIPGSEWLYAQLYGSPGTLDRVLVELVAPLRAWALEEHIVDHWFFIRYGDPEWHLRLRFHGDPERLVRQLLPALTERSEPWIADGRIRRLRFDTYRPELGRYGGPEALPLMEKLFWADSEAALGWLTTLSGDSFSNDRAADLRWPWALRGVHDLLLDFGFDLSRRQRAAEAMRAGFWSTYGHGSLGRELGKRLRPERRRLDAWLDADPDPTRIGDLIAGLPWLEQRRHDHRAWIEELRHLERRNQLQRPLSDIVPSLAHMHVNRVIRSAANAHELVIYDFLERLYASKLARRKAHV